DISIPPNEDVSDDDQDHSNHRLHRSAPAASAATPAPSTSSNTAAVGGGVIIDTLQSENARLIIVPSEAGRNPKIWAIHSLTMHDVSGDKAMPFQATPTNGVPPGEIVTSGSFGPWARHNPGATPLAGIFTFDKADLSVFNGIDGTLASRGSFRGALNRIDVNGETDTPDFVIEVGGHPFPLHTAYHAIVDGTTGDTLLERIDAQFLHSALVAKGAVLDGPSGQKGRTVSLDITM